MEHSSPGTTYERERLIAELAVQRAIRATEHVRQSHYALKASGRGINPEVLILNRADHSPVTIADFAAQALLVAAVHGAFPDDAVIAEESAAVLRHNATMRQRVWELVQGAAAPSSSMSTTTSGSIPDGGSAADGESHDGTPPPLAVPASPGEMLDLIDLGYDEEDEGIDGTNRSTSSGTGRVWTFDPIDGTQTYIEGSHYTVVAALLVNGVEQVGVIGCPTLSLDPAFTGLGDRDAIDPHTPGYLVSAVRGKGAQLRPLLESPSILSPTTVPIPKLVSPISRGATAIRLAENPRSARSVRPERHRALDLLRVPCRLADIYSTQLGYVACALGRVDAMWKIRPAGDRVHYIWDHAGGTLVLEEAGGSASDVYGKRHDFSTGREMVRHVGVFAGAPGVRERLVQAAARALI